MDSPLWHSRDGSLVLVTLGHPDEVVVSIRDPLGRRAWLDLDAYDAQQLRDALDRWLLEHAPARLARAG